jgi:hypothetical protein
MQLFNLKLIVCLCFEIHLIFFVENNVFKFYMCDFGVSISKQNVE